MLEKLLLFFAFFLPFQFALNPYPGVDLGVARVLAIAIFIIWLIKKRHSLNLHFFYNKQTILFLLFLSIICASIFFSSNMLWSLRKIGFILSFAPLYFVFQDTFSNEFFRFKIIRFFVYGAFIVAAIGIIQFISQFIFGIDFVYDFYAKNITPFFLGESFSQTVLAYPSWLVSSNGNNYLRAFSTFPDPHMFSYYLGILLPWSILLASKYKKGTNIFWIISLILLVADLLSFTRGGYVALFMAGFSVLPLVTRSVAKKIVLTMILILMLFYLVPNNPVGGRFTSSFNTQERSNQGRISNWVQALSVIKSHPFGTGIGAYSLAINPEANYRDPIYAHNLYLDIAAETSSLGLFVFLVILFNTFLFFYKKTKVSSFYIAAIASLVIFCTHSLVENPLFSIHILPLFILLLSLGSYSKISKDDEKNI
jgi:O-antigen ligase